MQTAQKMNELPAVTSINESLSHAEVTALYERIRLGDGLARHKMILANQGLIKQAVYKMMHRCIAVSKDEIMSEGLLGLIKAVDMFDPHRTYEDPKTGKEMNVAFSTYAMWWIVAAISNYLHQYNLPTHVPRNMQTMWYRVCNFMDAFYLDHEREASWEEITAHFNFKKVVAEHVQAQMAMKFVRLDHPLNHDFRNDSRREPTIDVPHQTIHPLSILETRRLLEKFRFVQRAIGRFYQRDATKIERILLDEYFSILRIIDGRPSLEEIARRRNRSENTVRRPADVMIKKLCARFKIEREDLLQLAVRIEETEKYLADLGLR